MLIEYLDSENSIIQKETCFIISHLVKISEICKIQGFEAGIMKIILKYIKIEKVTYMSNLRIQRYLCYYWKIV